MKISVRLGSYGAADPISATILESRADGTGKVRIPLIRSGQEIDNRLTAGGGKGKTRVGRAEIESMIRNFETWPGPVPFGEAPHVGFGERSGPQDAFIESLSAEQVGDYLVLFGVIDIVDAGMFARFPKFRGASIEFFDSPTVATEKFEGWTLVGGVLTNRPATDVHFKGMVAASADLSATARLEFQGETQMDLEQLAAKLEELTGKVSELSRGISDRDEKIASLEADLANKGSGSEDLDGREGSKRSAQEATPRVRGGCGSSQVRVREGRQGPVGRKELPPGGARPRVDRYRHRLRHVRQRVR